MEALCQQPVDAIDRLLVGAGADLQHFIIIDGSLYYWHMSGLTIIVNLY
jgi:hypothetical protein